MHQKKNVLGDILEFSYFQKNVHKIMSKEAISPSSYLGSAFGLSMK